jgi:hypothetical protein
VIVGAAVATEKCSGLQPHALHAHLHSRLHCVLTSSAPHSDDSPLGLACENREITTSHGN